MNVSGTDRRARVQKVVSHSTSQSGIEGSDGHVKQRMSGRRPDPFSLAPLHVSRCDFHPWFSSLTLSPVFPCRCGQSKTSPRPISKPAAAPPVSEPGSLYSIFVYFQDNSGPAPDEISLHLRQSDRTSANLKCISGAWFDGPS